VIEARFLRGDYDACNMLIDFMDSVENSNLTERQRQVLNLVFMQDLRQQDVAEMLNVSQQAVSDHISNAVKKIAFYNRMGAN
jgi:RNA polymerase sigma factor (sigma-70 family)